MQDFVIIKQAVSKELCKFVATEYELMEQVFINLYPGAVLSDLCDKSFARYSPLMMEALSVHLQPQIETATNLTLFPTYSYARIYYENSALPPHIDRASSQVTVSVCLEKDADWPLFIRVADSKVHEINLDVGDIVIYSGRKHEHWRDPLVNSARHIQAFLQYVDAAGDDAWLKWDTRACLGLPFEYTGQAIQSEMQQINSVLAK